MGSRRLHPTAHFQAQRKAATPTEPTWPSFPGGATYVGTSPSGLVQVWYDASLGQPALENANSLLATADQAVQWSNLAFGAQAGPVQVVIFALGGATDGTGGADHMACDFTSGAQIEVCASFAAPLRVLSLFEAELSECYMGGNLCGASTGEALSRWSAIWVGANSLEDFASVPTWVQDGMPDWVDRVEATDQDYDSIGCGMAFLSWLQSLGYPMQKIAPTMVSLGANGTLAQLYAQLTGKPIERADSDFQAALAALPGGPGAITTDDPFGAYSASPQPVPAPTPTTYTATLTSASPITVQQSNPAYAPHLWPYVHNQLRAA